MHRRELRGVGDGVAGRLELRNERFEIGEGFAEVGSFFKRGMGGEDGVHFGGYKARGGGMTEVSVLDYAQEARKHMPRSSPPQLRNTGVEVVTGERQTESRDAVVRIRADTHINQEVALGHEPDAGSQSVARDLDLDLDFRPPSFIMDLITSFIALLFQELLSLDIKEISRQREVSPMYWLEP